MTVGLVVAVVMLSLWAIGSTILNIIVGMAYRELEEEHEKLEVAYEDLLHSPVMYVKNDEGSEPGLVDRLWHGLVQWVAES